jgi:hypothetical protein
MTEHEDPDAPNFALPVPLIATPSVPQTSQSDDNDNDDSSSRETSDSEAYYTLPKMLEHADYMSKKLQPLLTLSTCYIDVYGDMNTWPPKILSSLDTAKETFRQFERSGCTTPPGLTSIPTVVKADPHDWHCTITECLKRECMREKAAAVEKAKVAKTFETPKKKFDVRSFNMRLKRRLNCDPEPPLRAPNKPKKQRLDYPDL